MTGVGPTGPTNPVQQVLQQTQDGLNALSDSTASVDSVSRTLQDSLTTLQQSGGKALTANLQQVNDKMLDKIANSLLTVTNHSAFTKVVDKGNLGNILQGLQNEVEKLREKKFEKRLSKKRVKVEKYEFVEFLNSTEKEFTRFVKFLDDGNEDENEILKFMLELMKRASQFKEYKSMKLLGHFAAPANSKDAARISALIEHILKNKAVVTNKRLQDQLSQIQLLINDFYA